MIDMQRIAAAALLCLVALAVPACAGIAEVPAGGTVFVGEEGLDITAAGVAPGGQLARFAPGSSVQTDAPSDLVTVGDPASFSVLPGTFGGATGAWYAYPARTLAFIVKEPALRLRVINARTGLEVGQGAVAGDELGFQVETNLYELAARPGVAGAPVTVHVRDPTGAEFTSLVNDAGVTTSLAGIPVNTSVFRTGAVWSTDPARYRPGTYEVWAESNVNSIHDNYGGPGRTTTRSGETAGVEIGGGDGPSVTVITSPAATATLTPAATVTAAPAETATATVTPTVSPTGTPMGTPTGTTGAPTTLPTATPTPSPGFGAATLALAALAGGAVLVARRR
ncbi:MAG: DUF3821 domain-containing protein [Methanospirillum sp.]|nr:DUF3821 domain-containing protein [Methanospirillum sp.]